MTLRWIISQMHMLPLESNFKQHFIDGRYNRQEHLLHDIIECLDQIAFYSSVGATAQVSDQKSVKKIHNARPKGRKRPGPVDPEDKPKRTFTDKRTAAAVFTQWTKKTTIDHILGCKINDGSCGCPRRLVDKH